MLKGRIILRRLLAGWASWIPRLSDAFDPLIRQGEDERGVPIYSGCPNVPESAECGELVRAGWQHVVIGFGLSAIAIAAAESRVKFGLAGQIILYAGFMWVSYGALRLGFGLSGRGKRRLLGGLVSIEDACAELNLPASVLESTLREGRRKPQYIVDGREFFRQEDLGDAMLLLRPADAEVSSESSLRAAGNSLSNDSQLLRPASGGGGESAQC